MSTFLTGLGVGFGVAVPLGAIGVLLVQEGIANGWRPAAAGATGVALVDLAYAAVAVTAGAAVTALLSGHERQVQVVGAAVLMLVVVKGLLDLRRAAPAAGPAAGPDISGPDISGPDISGPGAGAAPAGPAVELPTGSPWRVLRRFVALTAVNPLTALYFVVLTAGLGDRLSAPAAGAAFVAGVFVASWAWQLLLAAAGSLTGSRMPPWARTVTSLVGYAVVTGYALHLALG